MHYDNLGIRTVTGQGPGALPRIWSWAYSQVMGTLTGQRHIHRSGAHSQVRGTFTGQGHIHGPGAQSQIRDTLTR